MNELKAGLVSVIIPIHNRFEHANASIKSVVEQTYRPIELIIVDDASTTKFKPELPNDLKYISVHIERTDTNVGPGGAREIGRKRINGEFVAYLDSDDRWATSFIEEMTARLKNNYDIGMIYCTAISFSGKVIKRSGEKFDKILPDVLWGRPWHTSGCLWRRSLVDQIGSWMPLWRWEDYEYDVRAGCIGTRIDYIPQKLCIVRDDLVDQISAKLLGSKLSEESFAIAIDLITQHMKDHPSLTERKVKERLIALNGRAANNTLRHGLVGLSLKCLNNIREYSIGSRTQYFGYLTAIALSIVGLRSLSYRFAVWSYSQFKNVS